MANVSSNGADIDPDYVANNAFSVSGTGPQSALKSSSHAAQATTMTQHAREAKALPGSQLSSVLSSVAGNEGSLPVRPTEEHLSVSRFTKFSPIIQVVDLSGEATFEEELWNLAKSSKEPFRHKVWAPKMAQTIKSSLTKEGLERENQN